MQATDPQRWTVEASIQECLAYEQGTELRVVCMPDNAPPLTAIDSGRIMETLRENHRFDTLRISFFPLQDRAMLDSFRHGLPLCTSLTAVTFQWNVGNEELERLHPAFYNSSITILDLRYNRIHGPRGGEVLRRLLVGNKTLRELTLNENIVGQEVVRALGQGLGDNKTRLQKLSLCGCQIGNDGLTNLLPDDDGRTNTFLTELDLSKNDIQGEEGGRRLTLLLERFPSLITLDLDTNPLLGSLGARALAPGLTAAASQLEAIILVGCGLQNDDVANLVPCGQVNRSLVMLDLRSNFMRAPMGGEKILELASRCTNLDSILFNVHMRNNNQRCRLNLLLERKRLCTEASTLGGSPFSVLFSFVERAHRHEHGLSAIFRILQNDGEDHFSQANNRAMD
jgi:Leucine Rich repeat